jgi:hypothetical protein
MRPFARLAPIGNFVLAGPFLVERAVRDAARLTVGLPVRALDGMRVRTPALSLGLALP